MRPHTTNRLVWMRTSSATVAMSHCACAGCLVNTMFSHVQHQTLDKNTTKKWTVMVGCVRRSSSDARYRWERHRKKCWCVVDVNTHTATAMATTETYMKYSGSIFNQKLIHTCLRNEWYVIENHNRCPSFDASCICVNVNALFECTLNLAMGFHLLLFRLTEVFDVAWTWEASK